MTDYEQQYQALIEAGTAPNTRRAYTRDVRYFHTWAAASQVPDTFPISIDLVCRFILEHVQGLPAPIELALVQTRVKRPGTLTLPTLRRYLASLSIAHAERGLASPTTDTRVKLLLRRAAAATRHRPHQKAAITRDILTRLVATCDDSLRGVRDKAIMLMGFAAGGRRRSELTNLQVADLMRVAEGYLLQVRHSKTDQAGQGHTVPVLGEAAVALRAWLVHSGIRSGALFRGIKPDQSLTVRLCGDSLNQLIKRRIHQIGLDATAYGAHSLRAGFLTEAARQGVALADTMALSGHADAKVALRYYRASILCANPASKLL